MQNQFIFESEAFEFNPNFEFENTEYGFESSYESLESEIGRDGSDYIRWVQQTLNRVLGLHLAVDGDSGPQTRSAIRSFQMQKGLTVDGIVGANTEAALIAASGTRPPTTPTAPSSGGGTSTSVNTRLPRSGTGFYGSVSNSRQYGIPETIRALQNIAAAWHISHPQGPRIGIGDISFQGGGHMPPHKSHQKGVDIDIRLMRNDGVEGGTRYQNSEYSRRLTQELVDLIRANNVLSVRYIFFNDPQVRGVSKQSGHDNHLHVRFCAPNDSSCIRASQGEFEFESGEWETGNYESNPFSFEMEQNAAPTSNYTGTPCPVRSPGTTNIRCQTRQICPPIPNLLCVTSINGVPFEYVADNGMIRRNRTTGLYEVVRRQPNRRQKFIPAVVQALSSFLANMTRFGMPVEAILTAGSLYCRCIRNTNRLSNHSYGDAIDIVGIRWRSPNGSRETLVHNYRNPAERAILRRINECLRLSFPTVIDYNNADHRDHFHCDMNRGGRMLNNPNNYLKNVVQDNYISPYSDSEVEKNVEETPDKKTSPGGRRRNEKPSKEHTKNKRPSTEGKHEKGVARKARDGRGEKGDARRPFQR